MAFNSNFTHVRLRDDGALSVGGQSVPRDGTDAILVSLVHGSDEPRSAPVADPQLDDWEAVFPAGATPFATGHFVFVIGVARRAHRDPFVWQGGFEIQGQA